MNLEGVTDEEKLKAVRALYERGVLIESFCTERDDYLRKTDRPERMLDILEGLYTIYIIL
jgi:hypothetical protein